MSLGSLMQHLKTPIREIDLIPAKEGYSVAYTKEFHQFVCNEFKVKEDALFLTRSEHPILVIVEKPYAFAVNHLSIDYIEFSQDSLRYHAMKNQFLDMINQDKYEEYFSLEEDLKTSTLIYEFVKDSLPTERRYRLLKSIYTSNEYGFDQLLIDEFLNLSKQMPSHDRIFEHKLIPYTDDNGYLTVFRGAESESTDVSRAISWTLSQQTALMFGSRYTAEGRMFKGRAHISNVLEYLEERKEDEIISTHVEDIEELFFYKSEEIIDDLTNKVLMEDLDFCYYDVFFAFLNQMDTTLFHNPDGIHGFLHMKRVLLHTLTLSYKYDIPTEDTLILIYTAMYHDIGRVHDDTDNLHGINSWIKAEKHDLIHLKRKDDMLTAKFIIQHHNIDDAHAKVELSKSAIVDKNRAWKLYLLFCDADSLDRVRLGDLDIQQLRLEESPKLLMFAQSCLRHISQ